MAIKRNTANTANTAAATTTSTPSSTVKKVIVKNAGAAAKDISNRVKDDLKKYGGTAQQYDDQSLLVIKIQ